MLFEKLKKKPLKKALSLNEKEHSLYLDRAKHFPSSLRLWNSSIYFFNPKNICLIPHTNLTAEHLIKVFFDFYQRLVEKNIRSKELAIRFRKLSLNKIFLSKAQFKHDNNKVSIGLYVFNKQKLNYLEKIKKIYLSKNNRKLYTNILLRTLKNIQAKGFSNISFLDKNNFLLKRALYFLEKNKKYKLKNYKSLNKYCISFYRNILSLFMKKFRLLFFYKKLIYVNKSKLNYTYLRVLKKYLEILFNKNVEFNLFNLKCIYLNSDILSEALKIRISRKRQNLSRILKRLKTKIKVQKKYFYTGSSVLKTFKKKEQFVLYSLKYKHLTGFRFEASGRLTKRYTASRSQVKLIQSGNLLNIDNKKQISSVMLKSNLRSNIQFSKIYSKTRIGSFGLKGWISGN